MASFLYFIPNKQAVTLDDLTAAGITAIESLQSVGFCNTERGPSGGAGVVFAVEPVSPKGKLPKIGHYQNRQQWISCFGGQFWLGFETDNQPTPDDLQKAEMIAGHAITLEDGQEWTIPVARAFGRGSQLPQALILGDDGQLVVESLPKFAELSQQAERVFDAFLNDGEDLTLQDCWNIAVLALQQNYRVSGWELSALRALNTDNVQTVLGHLIDMPTILAAAQEQKKSHSDGDSLNAGDPA